MAFAVLPDAESVLVQALSAQVLVTAITSRIGTRIPDAPVWPLIRVTKVAERFTDEEGLEDSIVQVECWAESDSAASLLARTVVACRGDMSGTYAAGWLALVGVGSGPIPFHDPDSERFRYIVDLDVTTGA